MGLPEFFFWQWRILLWSFPNHTASPPPSFALQTNLFTPSSLVVCPAQPFVALARRPGKAGARGLLLIPYSVATARNQDRAFFARRRRRGQIERGGDISISPGPINRTEQRRTIDIRRDIISTRTGARDRSLAPAFIVRRRKNHKLAPTPTSSSTHETYFSAINPFPRRLPSPFFPPA